MATLTSQFRTVGAGYDSAEQYARIRLGLKQQGKPIPENDIWIAAICLEHGFVLATDDFHFESVDGLQVFKVV